VGFLTNSSAYHPHNKSKRKRKDALIQNVAKSSSPQTQNIPSLSKAKKATTAPLVPKRFYDHKKTQRKTYD